MNIDTDSLRSNLARLRGVACRFVLAMAAAAATAAQAQEQPALLVLGSAHFGNPGRDSINMDVEDVLSPARQREIEAVVQQLAAFRPTRIAIEVPSTQQEAVDERYASYRNGQYELTRNESDQIGMRLAARLGHERIYAVDWNALAPGELVDYDWHTYGQQNGHEDLIAAITDPVRARRFSPELKEQSIGAWLLQLNDPDALQLSHRTYFDIASVGDGENLIGATWVGTWYARNLKIYGRLVDLAPTANERVLVIYGQGHAYLLRQFAREHGHFELVDVAAVLTD